ncbi:MAG TPA: protein kinase, partial [Bacteroidota bacterium]|nr:protein kinase [Bacteroidota bacterium]
MIGQIISHYKILEKLGEGGMGIVYRAQDTKLDRVVALKFLPPQISATEGDKTRFTQEARAAAALNHPHICHIYRIDEVDAPPASGRTGEKLMFIEMEHVDGVTLRKKIAAGPIPLAEALNLATQIGEGLEEAHGKGIIHRDIKSDNVMVNSRNQAKVMDFGLAKLKGALKLTRSSSTVGTLAYMAPEQLRGVEADARSDIFSFGVLLYEMLTGRVPFEGAHEAALMYSITNEPPVPLEKYIPDAPAELLHIISRSLEKDPEDRYQTVHDMVIDIRRVRKDPMRVSQTSMPRVQASPFGTPSSDSISSGVSGGSAVSGFITPQPAESTPVPPPVSGPVPVAVQASGPATGEHADDNSNQPPPRRTSSVTIQIPTGKKSWMMITAIVVAIALAVVAYMQFGPSDDGGGKLSIAVADFQNQTQEPELDGLSGMLTTAMEQSKKLSVVTRSHMFDILKQMGKADVDKIDESVGKEICSKAGIGALVTASIRKLGKLYIIDLKVVDPSKNDYLFTAKEEGEGQESIPRMLDNLSEKTRAGLKEKADEIKKSNADLAVVTTTNMEAYQYYFKGEELLNKLDMTKAEEEFRKAVALDSLFGLAWYRLAYVVNWSGARSGRDNDAMPKALALIDRIPEKERYLLHALAEDHGHGYGGAIGILKDMEKHYPNDKEMVYNVGDWSYHDNDLSTAVTYLNRTLEIDPTFERALQHLTWTYRETGQYDRMLDAARRYVQASLSNE